VDSYIAAVLEKIEMVALKTDSRTFWVLDDATNMIRSLQTTINDVKGVLEYPHDNDRPYSKLAAIERILGKWDQ
jgi:hypothetical protein